MAASLAKPRLLGGVAISGSSHCVCLAAADSTLTAAEIETAAALLVTGLQRLSGALLPVVAATALPAGAVPLCVGFCPALAARCGASVAETLAPLDESGAARFLYRVQHDGSPHGAHMTASSPAALTHAVCFLLTELEWAEEEAAFMDHCEPLRSNAAGEECGGEGEAAESELRSWMRSGLAEVGAARAAEESDRGSAPASALLLAGTRWVERPPGGDEEGAYSLAGPTSLTRARRARFHYDLSPTSRPCLRHLLTMCCAARPRGSVAASPVARKSSCLTIARPSCTSCGAQAEYRFGAEGACRWVLECEDGSVTRGDGTWEVVEGAAGSGGGSCLVVELARMTEREGADAPWVSTLDPQTREVALEAFQQMYREQPARGVVAAAPCVDSEI